MEKSFNKMFRLVVLSALVAIAVGASPKIRPRVPMLDGRIVGGKDTDISEVPYQISLQSRGSHICGGSIVNERVVLTAAHCTDGASASSMTIRAGSSIRGSGGQVVQVSAIRQNPNYDPWNISGDVSCLHLADDIQLNDNAKPAVLAGKDHVVKPGDTGKISGWGTTTQGGSLPSQLKSVEVPNVSIEECRDAYGSSAISDDMICYGYPQGGKDSCQGDSGGPLYSNGAQRGVVSWGYGCAQPNYPGVYADVAVLSDTIADLSTL